MSQHRKGLKDNLMELINASKAIDFHKYGVQTVKSELRGALIHVRHEIQTLHMEFEGFGDLFGYTVKIYWDYRRKNWREYRVLATNFVGLNNTVCLCYEDEYYPPQNVIKLSVVPYTELSES
jgi:hypothetical protein